MTTTSAGKLVNRLACRKGGKNADPRSVAQAYPLPQAFEPLAAETVAGGNDALSLEYKLNYGSALGNVKLTDFVNDPVRAGVCSVFSLLFQEESFDLALRDAGSLLNDLPNATLVAKQRF